MRSKFLLVYVLHVFDLTSAAPPADTKLENVRRAPTRSFSYQLRHINYGLFCRLQPNGFPCNQKETIARFYYDTVMKTCMTFEYGECKNSPNKFKTLHECNSVCIEAVAANPHATENITEDLICSLQKDSGTCSYYYPMYYFDITSRTCRGFAYTGCGGNYNKFESVHDCKAFCSKAAQIPFKMNYYPGK